MDPSETPTVVVACPQCAGEVAASPADRPQVLDCPHCGEAFVLPAAGQTLAVAQVPGQTTFATDDAPAPRETDDLDGVRIRQITLLKRAAYRSRSYAHVLALSCLIGAGKCVWNVVSAIRNPDPDRMTAYGVVALWMAAAAACVYLTTRFYRRAERFRREAETTMLPAPATPPDFTPLSDGSHQWRNLERIEPEDEGK